MRLPEDRVRTAALWATCGADVTAELTSGTFKAALKQPEDPQPIVAQTLAAEDQKSSSLTFLMLSEIVDTEVSVRAAATLWH